MKVNMLIIFVIAAVTIIGQNAWSFEAEYDNTPVIDQAGTIEVTMGHQNLRGDRPADTNDLMLADQVMPYQAKKKFKDARNVKMLRSTGRSPASIE